MSTGLGDAGPEFKVPSTNKLWAEDAPPGHLPSFFLQLHMRA